MYDKLKDALNSPRDIGAFVISPLPSLSPIPFKNLVFGQFSQVETSMLFIDGGSAQILFSPSFSLDFIRIAKVYISPGVSKNISVESFFVLSKPVVKSGAVFIESELFSSPSRKFFFSSSDVSLSSVRDSIRRILELECVLYSSKEGVITVLDGSLDFKSDQESVLISSIKSLNLPVVALSKTSSLISNSAYPAGFALDNISSKAVWYSEIFVSSAIFFAKLNVKSKFVFRCDLSDSKFKDVIFPALSFNSSDPLFLGYPYGLILADRHARISLKEAQSLKFKISVNLNSDSKVLLNAVNAHDILDSMGY